MSSVTMSDIEAAQSRVEDIQDRYDQAEAVAQQRLMSIAGISRSEFGVDVITGADVLKAAKRKYGRLPAGVTEEAILDTFATTDKLGREVDKARGELETLQGLYYGARRSGHARHRAARQASGWGASFAAGIEGMFGDSSSPMRPRASLTPSGSVSVPSLTETVVLGEPHRPRRLLELVPWEGLDGTDQWAFLLETERTHQATEVDPGTRKPTSVYKVERQDRTTSTVAHLTEPIERQTLDDLPLLVEYVETALREGVEVALDSRILYGTSDNLLGIAETEGITTLDWQGDVLRTARLAVAALERLGFPLDAAVFIMSPEEWAALELKRSHDGDGDFLVDDQRQPIDVARQQLWGVQVVATPAVADDDERAWLVDMSSTTGRERERTRIEWTPAGHVEDLFGEDDDGDLFEGNFLRFRGEGRFGFAVTRPRGVIEFPTQDPTD